MKKSIVFLAMMTMSTVIFAQRHHRDGHAGERRSERMKKELSLTDDQVSKMKAIRVKFAERHRAIHRDTAMTQGTARHEQKKLRVQRETELKTVLTPEQWTKLKEMKARHAERRKRFHHHG